MPDPLAHPAPIADLTLVLGGARSGKSAYAEALVEGHLDRHPGTAALYVATAEAGDAEMAERIRQHRSRRGARWRTVEAPLEVAQALAQGGAAAPVLLDCLTLWLANLMAAGRDPAGEAERLLAAARAHPAPVVLVSNEVGLGIVPENALARAFRDQAGRLNQRAAAAAARVVFVAAGLPLVMKDVSR